MFIALLPILFGPLNFQADERVLVAATYFQAPTDTAMETADKTLAALLTRGGLKVVRDPTLEGRWQQLTGHLPPKRAYGVKDYLPDLPSPRDLLALGEAVKVEFVCVARFKFHADSNWIALGPKTKGYCTVDLFLVDVKNRQLDVEALKIVADSTRVEKGWETAAALIGSSLFTGISGGPKTPHYQRSAQLALAKALEPWLQARDKIAGSIATISVPPSSEPIRVPAEVR